MRTVSSFLKNRYTQYGAATGALIATSLPAHAAAYGDATAPALPGIDPASLTGFLAACVALLAAIITTAFSLRIGEVGWNVFKRVSGKA